MVKSPTAAFSLYSAKRRQHTIALLGMYGVGDEVTARHLARVITAIERNKEVQNIDSDEYESAYNGLIQTHLPRLSDEGIIEYDASRKVVTVTDQTINSALELMTIKLVLR